MHISVLDAADESKCNNVVLGPDPGEISGSGSTCYYSLRVCTYDFSKNAHKMVIVFDFESSEKNI